MRLLFGFRQRFTDDSICHHNATLLSGSLSEGIDSDNISYDNLSSPSSSNTEMVQKDVKHEPVNPKHIPNKDVTVRKSYLRRDRVSPDNGFASKNTHKIGVPNDDYSVPGGEQINDNRNTSSSSPTASSSPYNDSKGDEVGERDPIGNDRQSKTNRIQTPMDNSNTRKVKGSKRRGNKNSDDENTDENSRRKISKKKDRKRKRKLRKKKEKRRRGKTRKFGMKKSDLKKDMETVTTFYPLKTGRIGMTSPTTEYHINKRTSSSVKLDVLSLSNNKKTKGPRNVESSTGVEGLSIANEDLQISTHKTAM